MAGNSRSPPIKKSKNNNKTKTNIQKSKKETQQDPRRKQASKEHGELEEMKQITNETENAEEDKMSEDKTREEEWFVDPEELIGLFTRGDKHKKKDVKIEGYTPYQAVFGEGDTIHEAVKIRQKFEPDKRGKVHRIEFWLSLFADTLGEENTWNLSVTAK